VIFGTDSALQDEVAMKRSVLKSLLVFASMIFITTVLFSQEKDNEFAGSDACRTCHAEKYKVWKTSKHAAKPSVASADCLKCHAKDTNKEVGIGCEACHGQGKNHASSGDKTKIVSTKAADVCGKCHIGPNAEGKVIDPARTVPETGPNHRMTYSMWAVSGHSKANITCVSCHNPHNSANPKQLAMDREELCRKCHKQRAVLLGAGAKGIEDTRSFHSGVKCVSCHMTESNHLMKVIRPDDPNVPDSRKDTCTACHRDNNRKARAGQIQDWQAGYKKQMEPLQADIQAVKKALEAKPNLLDAKLKAKWDDLNNNVAILVNDKSNGAHNRDFSIEIMDLAAKDLKLIKAAIK
jgi:predicted CXXCH cytochrome family protein